MNGELLFTTKELTVQTNKIFFPFEPYSMIWQINQVNNFFIQNTLTEKSFLNSKNIIKILSWCCEAVHFNILTTSIGKFLTCASYSTNIASSYLSHFKKMVPKTIRKQQMRRTLFFITLKHECPRNNKKKVFLDGDKIYARIWKIS